MKNLSKINFGILFLSFLFFPSLQTTKAQCLPKAIKAHWDPTMNGVYCNGSGDLTCLYGCASIQ